MNDIVPPGTPQSNKDLRVDKLTARNIDLTGRRVINAGDPTDVKDYVTLQYLETALAALRKANNLK